MEMLTTSEVARRLDVTPQTVRNLVKAGKLKQYGKLPTTTGTRLFDAAEIDRYERSLAEAS